MNTEEIEQVSEHNTASECKVKAAKKKSFYSRLSFKGRNTFWGIIFLLPWIFGAFFFFLKPLVQTFYYALCSIELQNTGLVSQYTGFENFKYALNVDPNFKKELIAVLTSIGKSVPIEIFVSLFIALMLNGKYKGRGFFRVIFFIPLILSTRLTMINLAGVQISTEEVTSVINTQWLTGIIMNSGIPSSLTSMVMTFINDIFNVVTTAGVPILIFLAGLQGISPTLYEVAKIEGCTSFEIFCKITLPMVSPMILVCVVYSLAETFARANISDTIYKVTFNSGKYGLGAAMSVIYFIVSMAIIAIVSWIISKGVFYYDK